MLSNLEDDEPLAQQIHVVCLSSTENHNVRRRDNRVRMDIQEIEDIKIGLLHLDAVSPSVSPAILVPDKLIEGIERGNHACRPIAISSP